MDRVRSWELTVRVNYSERKRENGYCVENRKTHKCERKHLLSYKHFIQFPEMFNEIAVNKKFIFN